MAELWCDLSGAPDVAEVGELVNYAPVDYVLSAPAAAGKLAHVRRHDRVRLACLAGSVDELAVAAEAADTVVVTDPALITAAGDTGRDVGVLVVVDDGPSLQRCRDVIGTVDHLIVEFADPTNIPLELLLAAAQGTRTKVVKRVAGHADAVVTAGVLETGPAGLMFAVADLGQAAGLARDLLASQRIEVPLVEATVTAVRHAGMGYRGCVDTTWLFGPDEGMIVGSTSSGGLLVCAEVHYLPYMNLRPFRVNAGGVHSYVWSDGVTEYITDLAAGSTVLAVDTAGSGYPVKVGRVKTELRPLRLIEAEADGVRLNVFLQDDWHVRIFDAAGAPTNCTSVIPGTKLLAYRCEPGRHVGIKVAESITES
jgi:3-amino-4-hydroxybenzoic acid synthase